LKNKLKNKLLPTFFAPTRNFLACRYPSKISKKFHPKIQKFVPATILQKFDRKICIAIITQQKIVS